MRPRSGRSRGPRRPANIGNDSESNVNEAGGPRQRGAGQRGAEQAQLWIAAPSAGAESQITGTTKKAVKATTPTKSEFDAVFRNWLSRMSRSRCPRCRSRRPGRTTGPLREPLDQRVVGYPGRHRRIAVPAREEGGQGADHARGGHEDRHQAERHGEERDQPLPTGISTTSTESARPTETTADRDTDAGIASAIRPTVAHLRRVAPLHVVDREVDGERQQHPGHHPELDRVDGCPGDPVEPVTDQDPGVVELSEKPGRSRKIDREVQVEPELQRQPPTGRTRHPSRAPSSTRRMSLREPSHSAATSAAPEITASCISWRSALASSGTVRMLRSMNT